MIPDSDYFLPWEKIEEIIDWVEGPKILVESNSIEYLEKIDGHILSNMFASLPLSKEAFFRTTLDEVTKGLPSGRYIISVKDDLEKILQLDQQTLQGLELFLDISEMDLDRIVDLPHHGLVIQGGEEEKIGLKSFEELDRVYEWLMDEEA